MTADTMPAPAAPRPVPWWQPAAVKATQWAARAVVKARRWRLHLAFPGIAGCALISAGLGLRLGLWAGLIAAGVALLRIDSRL